ncbi:MAG: histidine phosphatase family protein [Gammaproteobacteria bacterium]|nr:histidine phosphatase family protein [Gammaproteobacteria bacterium]
MRKEYANLRRRPFLTPIWLTAGAVLLGAVIWSAFAWSISHLPATTVIVTRHAEKLVDGSKDPPLSPEGQARAGRLATQLGAAGIDAIFVTEFRRTRETGEPLARKLGLQVQVVKAGGDDELARRILREHRGGHVLVIGHSNTVPALVSRLGGVEPPVLDDTSYGDVFVVTLPRFSEATVTRLKLD